MPASFHSCYNTLQVYYQAARICLDNAKSAFEPNLPQAMTVAAAAVKLEPW